MKELRFADLDFVIEGDDLVIFDLERFERGRTTIADAILMVKWLKVLVEYAAMEETA